MERGEGQMGNVGLAEERGAKIMKGRSFTRSVQRVSVILGLLLSPVTPADTDIEQAEPQSSEDRSEVESKAAVYLYRLEQSSGSLLKPGVFCDGVRLARIANGRYFIARLDPGHHVFRSSGEKASIKLNLVGGQTYFIQVVIRGRERWQPKGYLLETDGSQTFS